MRELLAGIVKGSDGVRSSLDKITKLVEKSIKGKGEEKRQRAILKSLKGEFAALVQSGKQQDRNTRKLEKARDAYKQLADTARQYAATIKQSFVDFGNITNLGRNEDGTVSGSTLLQQLRDREAQAKRFAALVRSLASQGLSRTSIQQLLDAGPEAATATAEALASGGAAAIAEINRLTASLAASGAGLGDQMRTRYYGAGLQAAEGLVKGLEKMERKLDRVAERLADTLVKAIKKKLGIKSPSTVFRGLGENSVKGLALGLDETYVRRQGARVSWARRSGLRHSGAGCLDLARWRVGRGRHRDPSDSRRRERPGARAGDHHARQPRARPGRQASPGVVRQQFKTADVLKLEIEAPWPALANLVPNPTGETGAWGWQYGDGFADLSGLPIRLTLLAGSKPTSSRSTSRSPRPDPSGCSIGCHGHEGLEPADPRPGQLVRRTTHHRVSRRFTSQIGPGLMTLATVAIPRVRPSPRSTSTSTSDTGADCRELATGSSSPTPSSSRAPRSEVDAYEPLVHPGWADVLGYAHDLRINRQELDQGTLSGTLIASSLDPAVSPLIRAGKRCKLSGAAGDDWSLLITGQILSASVSYDLLQRDEEKRARIALDVVDNAAPLAASPRQYGVGTIAELPYVLRGTRVPWNVNGSSAPIAPGDVTVLGTNDNASALDQVAITRDTALGYAWVDRFGVLQAWDAAEISTTPGSAGGLSVLDEDEYRDIEVGFDILACVNAVTVNLVTLDPGTGETNEVAHGPYRDEQSVREWGVRPATFTIYDDGTDPSTYANAILSANSTPARRVLSVVVPIALEDAVAKTLIDLYDVLTVSNERADVSEDLRVVGIEHAITADRWMMTLTFSGTGSVATPTVAPTPAAGEGGKTLGELLRPVGEMTSLSSATVEQIPPAGCCWTVRPMTWRPTRSSRHTWPRRGLCPRRSRRACCRTSRTAWSSVLGRRPSRPRAVLRRRPSRRGTTATPTRTARRRRATPRPRAARIGWSR